MELTICVCDNCGTRHELDPATAGHSHGARGQRLPPGWFSLQLIAVPPAPEAASGPELSVAMREACAKSFASIADMLRQPTIPIKEVSSLMRALGRQIEPLVDSDGLHQHGPHLEPKVQTSLLCASCTPVVRRAVDNASIELRDVDRYTISGY